MMIVSKMYRFGSVCHQDLRSSVHYYWSFRSIGSVTVYQIKYILSWCDVFVSLLLLMKSTVVNSVLSGRWGFGYKLRAGRAAASRRAICKSLIHGRRSGRSQLFIGSLLATGSSDYCHLSFGRVGTSSTRLLFHYGSFHEIGINELQRTVYSKT